MKELFDQQDDDSDPHWIIKSYFNRMYVDGYLLEALGHLVKKWGFSTDGAYCNFANRNSFFNEDHFDGVEFCYGYPPGVENTIVVSEEDCSNYIKLACKKYLQHHPEDFNKAREILDLLSF